MLNGERDTRNSAFWSSTSSTTLSTTPRTTTPRSIRPSSFSSSRCRPSSYKINHELNRVFIGFSQRSRTPQQWYQFTWRSWTFGCPVSRTKWRAVSCYEFPCEWVFQVSLFLEFRATSLRDQVRVVRDGLMLILRVSINLALTSPLTMSKS